MTGTGHDAKTDGAPRLGPEAPPRISIALCTYNGARFLKAQLDSYLGQTRLPDELLACDDGSGDETLAILHDFERRAPFPVRIVQNQTRLGSTKNFEKAIGLCTGDVIATSDQDDVWLPEKLALSEAALARNPRSGLVFTNADVVDDALRPRGHRLWDAIRFGPLAQRQVRQGRSFEALLRQWVVTGATMMFRARFRGFVLPIPEIWVHDAWIAFIIGAMAPVEFIEHSTVKYRQHGGQQIGGKKLGLRDLYRKARELGPPYFRLAYEQFLMAHERLRAFAGQVRCPEYLAMVERKVEHQRRRLAISECPSRKRRVLLATDELFRGGYRRYSPGFAHFLKDAAL